MKWRPVSELLFFIYCTGIWKFLQEEEAWSEDDATIGELVFVPLSVNAGDARRLARREELSVQDTVNRPGPST